MVLEFHEFGKEEYGLRFAKARDLLAQHQLDAILVGDEKNYRYFTGDRPPTKNRPTFVLLSLHGDPVVIVSEFGAKTAKFITSISDVRDYPLPFSFGVVADAIRSRKVKRLGVECDDRIFGAFHSAMQWGEFERMKKEPLRDRVLRCLQPSLGTAGNQNRGGDRLLEESGGDHQRGV